MKLQSLMNQINQSFPMVQFATLGSNHLICYLDALSIDVLAKSLICIQEKLITLQSLNNEEKVLVNATKVIFITYFFIYMIFLN